MKMLLMQDEIKRQQKFARNRVQDKGRAKNMYDIYSISQENKVSTGAMQFPNHVSDVSGFN